VAVDLVVVGGGRMGVALVGGLLATGALLARQVAVVEASEGRRQQLAAGDGLAGLHPGLAVVSTPADAGAGPGHGVVLAVKPSDVAAAAALVAPTAPGRVLSVAAGVTLTSLRSWLPAGAGGRPALLRSMPNTPALIGAGAAGLAAGGGADGDDTAWAEGILGAVGIVVGVDESLLDAVTGLSGSGPAYVFLLAEALVDAGVLVGLPREVARRLSEATLVGAARMLAEGDEGPGALRAEVTSPGGTTAAGVAVLEAGRLRAVVAEAVLAATTRSGELGR